MAGEGRKIVWVLGTGFSVPLGGPMLKDLLSPTGYEETLAVHPDAKGIVEKATMNTISLFNHYVKGGSSPHPVWDDAEAFLDYVDTARLGADRPGRARLSSLAKEAGISAWGSLTAEAIRGSAVRVIAAQCCAFLKHADQHSEPWQPYVTWANALLRQGDTIITFNYDCVLERLNAYRRSLGPLGDYMTILATDPHSDAQWKIRDRPRTPNQEAGLPCVLKLHGSTGWSRTAREPGNPKTIWDYRHHIDDDQYALKCDDVEQIAIATPGPGKLAAARQLEPLWNKALEALKEADAIVFIGYRFPKSDADARAKLLGAITENTKSLVRVHTVLGPSLDDDTIRLQQMVTYAMRGGGRSVPPESELMGNVFIHRLWSQDFMSLATRKDLLERNRW